MPQNLAPLVLLSVAGALLALTLHNYIKRGSEGAAARRAWLRVAGIFAVIGSALLLFSP